MDEQLDERALQHRWLDVDHRLREAKQQIEQTFYGGDALPIASIGFGPGILPALLGRPYRLAAETVWFDGEPLGDAEQLETLSLQRTSAFYKAYLEATTQLLAQSQGRYLVPEVDLGTTIDILAALYDKNKLLEDTILEPDRVLRLLDRVESWRNEALAEFAALKEAAQAPPQHIVYAPIANEQHYRIQGAELGVLLSPQTFDEIIVSSLNRGASSDEPVIYLLDGDSYTRYLPQVLKLTNLHAIVWSPNTRCGTDGHAYKNWLEPASIELCRAVQEQGVKLIILGIPSFQVLPLLEQISPDGIFLKVSSDSREQAETLLHTVYERHWNE
jgi:hypothetical protein